MLIKNEDPNICGTGGYRVKAIPGEMKTSNTAGQEMMPDSVNLGMKYRCNA